MLGSGLLQPQLQAPVSGLGSSFAFALNLATMLYFQFCVSFGIKFSFSAWL
jgi:hypothetical protein